MFYKFAFFVFCLNTLEIKKENNKITPHGKTKGKKVKKKKPGYKIIYWSAMVIKWIRSMLSASRQLVGKDHLGNLYFQATKGHFLFYFLFINLFVYTRNIKKCFCCQVPCNLTRGDHSISTTHRAIDVGRMATPLIYLQFKQ